MYALLPWLSGWPSHCSAVVAGCFHSVAFSLEILRNVQYGDGESCTAAMLVEFVQQFECDAE